MKNPQEHDNQLFSIKPVHDVLYVSMSGSWSPDVTHDYVAEYKKLVHRYFAREWAAVIDIQNLEMLVSENFQIETFRALNTWSFIKGMKSILIVSSEHNRSYLLYQFEEIFEDKQSFDKVFCFSQEQAEGWLTDAGFSVPAVGRAQQIA